MRNRVGQLYLEFLLDGPRRAGLLHADPHPGNFRLTPDGRLGVIDYGAVARLPGGIPPVIGALVRQALDGDAGAVIDGLRAEGFILPGIEVDPDEVLSYVLPFIEPLREPEHAFTREWLRGAARGAIDVRAPEFATGLRMNMPREYAMIHRVFVGATGVLSQLGATIPARGSMERLLPGFADE
ncbi:AarF/UbiB family protein [Janibacter limosus]|uniref:AarF/UbiB family protein n=1 Tax=Janibacter limosus TaxID=53458 RepID=UPI0021524845|nr:AarF/UbiB family protein [Janibacter limosus]WKV16365.1 AarF/UbiB family protein [Janibacter limosus]